MNNPTHLNILTYTPQEMSFHVEHGLDTHKKCRMSCRILTWIPDSHVVSIPMYYHFEKELAKSPGGIYSPAPSNDHSDSYSLNRWNGQFKKELSQLFWMQMSEYASDLSRRYIYVKNGEECSLLQAAVAVGISHSVPVTMLFNTGTQQRKKNINTTQIWPTIR